MLPPGRYDQDPVNHYTSDSGIGMPEVRRNQIFGHWFTTMAVGKGTGPGLAVARQVMVERHHGALKF
jgi:signal transduction histidine kinase